MNDALSPQSLDAEESVLGSMLLAPGAIEAVTDVGLSATDFYRPSHGHVFTAILALYGKDQPADPITVVDELNHAGTLEVAGGAERVHELAMLVPAASNARHYAKIVRETAARREVIALANRMAEAAFDGGSVEDVLADADAQLLKFQAKVTQNRDRVFTAKDIVAEYRELLAAPLDEDMVGVRSPFSFLPPLMGSRVYVLAGYTGHGKTAGALQFVGSGCEGGARVGLVTNEMSHKDLTHRLVASFGVPYHDVRTGHIAQGDKATVEKALGIVEEWDFEVIDDEEVDPSQIRRDQRSGKYDFLVIDHLHNIRIRDKRHPREELEDNVQQIANISKEFGVPVLLLAQLSREEKRNPFPRPTNASLKGTGKIEQVASHVWFIWRQSDEHHQPTTDAEFLITKNRYGGLGFKNLHFRASQVRFTEASSLA